MGNNHAPKILYIPPTFGEPKSGLASLECNFTLERAIIRTFRDNGFDVVVGRFKQENNPNAVGIGVDSLPYVKDASKFHKFLDDKAIKTGATMPHEFTWDEMLTTETPIIAKGRGSHGGDDKYLLTDYEQKMRFLVWGADMQSYFWIKGKTADAKYQAAKQLCQDKQKSLEILAGLTDNKEVDRNIFKKVRKDIAGVARGYQFQEYVTSPSGKNASFRVVVDAKGDIHYVTFITSEFERVQYDMSNWGDHPWDALERNPPFTFRAYIFINHPNSPMHIPKYRIVSNRLKGGSTILLFSNLIDRPDYSKAEKELLEAHGLNPDNPQLPDEVLELSRRIAFEFRSGYPYGGTDFIQNPKGDFLFLEHNYMPYMDPKALGLDPKNNADELTLEMMKRVAKKF